jgi:hypothetical protein
MKHNAPAYARSVLRQTWRRRAIIGVGLCCVISFSGLVTGVRSASAEALRLPGTVELPPPSFAQAISAARSRPPIVLGHPRRPTITLSPFMTIEVEDVYCGNTEDIHGEDELYLVGAVENAGRVKGLLTSPLSINDDQHGNFSENERVLFARSVQRGSMVHVALAAFDEDVGKDWANYDQMVKEIADVAQEASKLGGRGVQAGVLVGSVTAQIISKIVAADGDDHLGDDFMANIPVDGPAHELLSWDPYDGGDWFGYSSWNYGIKLLVTRYGV